MGQAAELIDNQEEQRVEIEWTKYPPLDLYIMIPCVKEKELIMPHAVNASSQIVGHLFLNAISTVSAYEMEDGFSVDLTRMLLCQVSIVCHTDDVQNKVELGRQTVNVYLTTHKGTGLASVTLVFPDITLSVTHILDQMSRNELFIDDNGNTKCLLKWLHENFGLKRMGMSRSFSNLSSSVEEKELIYLLANEVNGSQVMKHQLIGSNFKAAAKMNVAQYDLSEIYIQETSIVQIYKEYQNSYEERIQDHVLTLFIMELLLMQDVAISRVSHRVSEELQGKSDISLKVIEELNLDFAKTMFLWNLNNFKYSATQAVANSFIKGFKIQEQLETYKTNKGFLEDLITVITARSTDRKNWILNIGIIFLTISQVLPIYYDITKKIVEGNVTAFDIRFAGSTTLLAVAVLIIVRSFTKRSKNK